MRTCAFNFNNEVDSFEIHVEDDGRVRVPGEDGQILAEYDNIQQLAEIYAQARDVKPENLKNWVLLENGDVYSFVLRAGTAGVDVAEVEEQLEQAFDRMNSRYHALSVMRAKEQVMADGTADVVEALVHCTETDIARDVYDMLSAVINGTAVASVEELAEEPVQEVDTRSDLEKYIDEMAEIPGAVVLIASLVGLSADTDKAALLEALNASVAFHNVSNLRSVFNNIINDTINTGIGVENQADALTVLTQIPNGVKDDAMKARTMATAKLAGRSKVNLAVNVVGRNHIRRTAELVPVEDLEDLDLFVSNNTPYIVRFSDTVDAELEAERDAAAAAEEEDDEYEEDYFDEDDVEDEDDIDDDDDDGEAYGDMEEGYYGEDF